MMATHGCGEVVGGAAGRVRVDVVVVRHGLAVQELRGGDPVRGPGPDVQRRALVRVLAVAQHIGPPPQGAGHLRPAAVAGDLVRARTRRRTRTRPRRRTRRCARTPRRPGPALVQGETAPGQRGEHVGVPGRVGDDGHRAVVLGRGADHGRAADVDLLDALAPARRRTRPWPRTGTGWTPAAGTARCRARPAQPACPGSAVSASRPACTRGCRVFTRPSRHSGKPVSSSTGVTGTPAAPILAAVLPVETISTPAACSPAASSSRPVLS